MGVRACEHCGLATATTGAYCCYGCELAARVAGEGRDRRTADQAVITLSLLLSMVVMMLSLFLFAEDVYADGARAGLGWMRSFYRGLAAALSTPVVIMLGVPLGRRAVAALRERRLTMDLLVVVGAGAAYGVSVAAVLRGHGGVYFDSATAGLLLSTVGRYLEATARASAARVLGPSLALGSAPVLAGGAGEELRLMSPAEVQPGMRVRVAAEQVVPVDLVVGVGADGASEVEVTLSVLTGAAAPVHRRAGEEVPAGAVPVSGPLEGVALRAARDSTLERLAALSKSLAERSTRLLRLADGFAAALVPVVAVVAAATFAFTAWSSSVDRGVVAALAVVLAACPCTYGVATPLVLWVALRKGLEHGACIRSASAIEQLGAVTTVAFDKTGTLTSSDLAVLRVEVGDGADPGEVAALVAGLEAESRHPVAMALARWSRAAPAALSDKRIVVGKGVAARDAAGRPVRLGASRWASELAPDAGRGDDAGHVRVTLAREGAVLARFAIGESVRPEAHAAVDALARMGIASVMLTGDTAASARAIAASLGLSARGDLAPEDKVAALEALGAGVAMVGDGLNDAPALAAIGPSFAMHGGAGLARGTAQVTLLREDLRLVPWTLGLARRATAIGWQNLVASSVYNLVFIGLAAAGALRPVWAGLSMLTSSLLTLGSSMRVNAIAGPEGAADHAASEDRSAEPARVPVLEGGR